LRITSLRRYRKEINMTSPVDPNQICLTGENSFIRLAPEQGAEQTTRTSHWRVLWSPGGAGHVLFLKSADLAQNPVRVYSDNIALTRYLQGEIESMLFPEFADPNLPVIPAQFSRSGDISGAYNETAAASTETVVLSWHDFLTPFMLNNPAGSTPGRPHGVYSCFTPAKEARIIVNGEQASGRVVQEMRGERPSSTACLAWSETWVRP
jgi:hypothetical protein